MLSLIEQDELIISPQNIYEFYVVATRPAHVNGFGLSSDEAIAEVTNLSETYRMLPETEEVFRHWLELVTKYNVTGKSSHDARLVAFMQYYQIRKLYTLNQKDFTRYGSLVQLM